jgi:hypothetical protein
MAERYAKWEPIGEIACACADISFDRAATGRDVSVVMHFSRTRGAPPIDLELGFREPIALRWSAERFAYGWIPVPSSTPMLDTPGFERWAFPLLKVIESSWLPTLGYAIDLGGYEHFVLVSMNDTVHVAARPDVSARWSAAHTA